MTQKPNYYEVLGVPKNATPEEIKKAHKSIMLKCHPDMLKNKTEAEKVAAAEKFKNANEANEVLSDPGQRATYDQFGHDGLQNLKNAGMTSTSSPTPGGKPEPRRMHTTEDTFSFFDRRAEQAQSAASTTGEPRESAADRRRRIAEEEAKAREARRNAVTVNKPPAATPSAPAAKDAFQEVAEKVGQASERLKDAVVPVEVLERFRNNLKDFLNEIDAAITRSRNNGGPKP